MCSGSRLWSSCPAILRHSHQQTGGRCSGHSKHFCAQWLCPEGSSASHRDVPSVHAGVWSASVLSPGCPKCVSQGRKQGAYARDDRPLYMLTDQISGPYIVCRMQAKVSGVSEGCSEGSCEYHGASGARGSFQIKLDGPANLWGTFQHFQVLQGV